MRLRSLVLVTALAGCSFSAPEGGGEYACSAAAPECPTGTMCIDGRCGVAADATPPSAFGFRQKVAVELRGGDELADVPVLIQLDPETFDYGAVQPGGADLRFFDRDDTPLAHEIEEWSAGGRSLVWVEVPELTGQAVTDSIWMYYGNPDLPPAGGSEEVWTAYQAVYHLGAATADSGPRGLDAVPTGTERGAGVIGDGHAFDGVVAHLTLPEKPDLLRGVPGMTLEAWVRPSVHEKDRVVVAVSTHGSVESRAQFKVTATGKVRLAFRADDLVDSLVNLETPGPIPAEAWSWIAVVADLPADTVAIYVNGSRIVEAGSVGFADATVDTVPDSGYIGMDEEAIEQYDGVIDELRIAGAAMSEEWITAQYASMTGALVTLEEPEAL